MKKHVRRIYLFAHLLLGACASPVHPAGARATLRDESTAEPLGIRASRAPLTVLVFFSADCPVQKAHDGRLRALASTYGARGVAFAAVVSEQGVEMAQARAEARRRGLPLPVLEDRGAAIADALAVEYSAHAVVLDRSGHVLYSGALDSDRTHLTADAEPYLAAALDAALAGRPVAKARTEALGCPLEKH